MKIVFQFKIEVYSLISKIFSKLKPKPNNKIVKNQTLIFISLFFLFFGILTFAQQEAPAIEKNQTSALFQSEEPLPIRIQYSAKEMRRDTNDSTYLDCMMSYQDSDGQWDSLAVRARARGNWRKENCFMAPIKLKIKKSNSKGTVFEGNKEFKLVLPCRNSDTGEDYVLKEYLAYKLYEDISPYHFNTRRLSIELTDIKGKKAKEYQLEGFLIEDIDKIAERHDGRKLKRKVHPLQQDDLNSIRNDFFQFLIGNTDFSVAYQHNEKLLFVEGLKAIPIPYDFDMCGLVDANYAVVSQVQGETLAITSVTQRLYRGFKRDAELYQQVRKEFLSKKPALMQHVDDLESSFYNPKQFESAKKFVLDFFAVLESDSQFKNQILDKARTK